MAAKILSSLLMLREIPAADAHAPAALGDDRVTGAHVRRSRGIRRRRPWPDA